jgi:N-carbamoyl-D-amino-acid hydrolase
VGLFGDKEDKTLRQYHSDLAVKSNAYFNSCFAVSVGKCGKEEGQDLLAGSIIVDPTGRAAGQSEIEDDDVVVRDIDLDESVVGKQKMFDFARHRRPECYTRLVEQKGAIELPPYSAEE